MEKQKQYLPPTPRPIQIWKLSSYFLTFFLLMVIGTRSVLLADGPPGFVEQPSYTQNCSSRPAGSICFSYNDGYTWLVYDSIAGWGEAGSWQGKKIVVAHGLLTDYYHVLGTSFVSSGLLIYVPASGSLSDAPDSMVNSLHDAFDRIRKQTSTHPLDLALILQTDEQNRTEYLEAYKTVAYTLGLTTAHPLRTEVYEFVRDLISDFPRYYSKVAIFDRKTENVMVWIRELAYRILIDAVPITPDIKTEIAVATDLPDIYFDIWNDFGIFLLDNTGLDDQQLKFIHNYLCLTPSRLHNLKTISVKDFLGEKPANISLAGSGGGVNIFGTRVGGYRENSFPSDSEPGIVDGFSVVVSHEINHVVDAYTLGKERKMVERKHTLIEQAAPSDVIFIDHSKGLGMDWDATKTNFQLQGYWDGLPDSWNSAWDSYWDSGPGSEANSNWLRDNLKHMCEAPQEAFATLANQYFTNSEIMLNLALDRFNNGRKMCINQFLFFADIYSVGGNKTLFYVVDTEGNIQMEEIFLSRDIDGHINSLITGSGEYRFALDENANVLAYLSEVPASVEDRPYDLNHDGTRIGRTEIFQNYPNPFNPDTWIPYQLSEYVDIMILIHDVSGKLMRTLNLGHKTAGFYTDKSKAAYWDGKNDVGEQVSSGMYFYTIQAGAFTATKKMVVAR